MIVTIHNDQLTLTADTLGAQMQSITSYKGTEYLWNGDERYWKGRAPVLFPFVARLKDKTYTVNGGTHQMKIHGFASACEFEVAEQTESRVTFVLRDNEVTRAQFPFAFLFKVRYALKESTVEVTYTVDNPEDEMLHFGLGGHPGFNVPLKEGTSFEDYYLLALAKHIVYSYSNLKFGPEVGISRKKKESVDVVEIWLSEIERMEADLEHWKHYSSIFADISLGDARSIPQRDYIGKVDCVITSPPYPNEKDYSRTTRLESVILGFINTKDDLRN